MFRPTSDLGFSQWGRSRGHFNDEEIVGAMMLEKKDQSHSEY